MTQNNDITNRLAEAINGLIDQVNNEQTEAAVSEESTFEDLVAQAIYSEYPSVGNETIIPEQSYDRIPTNSETITIDMSTSRFSSAVWFNKVQEKTITLAGLGGIGRFGNLNNIYYQRL